MTDRAGTLDVRHLSRDVRVEAEYLLHVPATAMPSEGFPLVLYLHGAGERESLDHVASFGPPAIARASCDFEWVVVAPRCPPTRSWETAELLALLDEALAALPVDPARVVVTGLSMGGFGCWGLAMSAPERLAAAVPICGGAPGSKPRLIQPRALEALRRLPIRAYHGAEDTVVLVSESVWITNELRALGCDVELTVYPGVGHDSWTRTYADPGLGKWMADARRYDSR